MDNNVLKKDNVAHNFTYQFAYQALVLFLPLILSPFLTRTLKEETLGIYTFVNSIANYFYIIANLGISKHGQRIIAQRSSDRIQLRKTFWSLFFLHIIISLCSIAMYVFFVCCFIDSDTDIYLLHILFLLFPYLRLNDNEYL